LGLVFVFALISTAQAVEMKLPKIEKETLDNGLDVYIIEQHEVPIVSMRLVIPGGSIYDDEETAGLANLTAGLLRKGTKTRTADEVSEAIDFVGGSLGAGAGADAVNATCTVLSKHLAVGLDLLADIVINPVFDEEEVNKLKDQIVGGIMQGKSDPTTIRNIQFDKYMFGDHPYGLPNVGNEETILMLTGDDVKDFYNKYFIPNNAFLLIVGDVKAKEVLKTVGKSFGKWKAGTAPELNLPEYPKIEGHKIILIDKTDATQSFIAMGNHGLTRYSEDAFKVRVMNYILGGGGFASRLMQVVRSDMGLTYGINSGFGFNKYTGAFYVNTFTKNESTGEAIRAIFGELEKIRTGEAIRAIFGELEKIRENPVEEKELNDTRSFYTGYIPLQFETPADIASWLQTIYLYDLGEDYYDNYLKGIEATTMDDVQQMARKYIDPENMLIVVVGKAEDVKTQLEEFGEVTVIPLIEL
jgi:zinc protease